MTQRREFITACGDLIRANVMTEYGASSQTCRTTSEARGFFDSVRARDAERERREAEKKT